MSDATSLLSSYELSPPQARAARARGRDVLLRAGAGTGKTRTLVARYLALLEDGLPLRGIVAITFTRKAAREMRNRVRAAVDAAAARDAAGQARWAALSMELDAARIGTIDSFCADILRSYPAEAGLDPHAAMLDETESALLVAQAVEETLAWAVTREEALPLLILLGEAGTHDLLTALLQKRTAVAEALAALDGRDVMAWWSGMLAAVQREAALALLANPALDAARARLARVAAHREDDLAEVGRRTAVAALDEIEAALDAGNGSWQLAWERLHTVKSNVGRQSGWPGGKEQLQEVKADLKRLLEAWNNEPLLGLELNALDKAAAQIVPIVAQLFAYAEALYTKKKAELEALDFADLETLAIELLANHAGPRAYWQAQVQALLVDEYQDTDARQSALIRLLCPEPGKLFIVGDAKQSIYRFRGADVTVFRREQTAVAADAGLLLDLDTSYRAHAALLQGMNDLLAPVLGGEDAARPWHAPFEPLLAAQEQPLAVAEGLAAPFVRLQVALGNKPQAMPLAAAALVEELLALFAAGTFRYQDVGILCRSARSFSFYEDALDAAGVPYVTVAGRGFYDRPEVRDLLNALAALEDPHDDLALAGLLRSPALGLRDAALYGLLRDRPPGTSLWSYLCQLHEDHAFPDDEAAILDPAVALIADLHGQAGRAPVADILKAFLDRTQYRAGLVRAADGRALRNVSKLLEDVHQSQLVSIADFLEYLTLLRESHKRVGEARATAEGAVQIMTIHQAKGLEFPVVVLGDAGSQGGGNDPAFLLHPEAGLLPFLKEDKARPAMLALAAAREADQEAAENGRLLYVALTRARQLLLVNGSVSGLKQNGSFSNLSGYLRQLFAVCGVDKHVWDGCDPQGSDGHALALQVGETAVSLHLYEGGYEAAMTAAPEAPAPVAPVPASLLPAPLPPPTALRGPERVEAAQARRVPRVLPRAEVQRPRAPQWLVGTLVHEALAAWRFPDGDPQLGPWAAARASELGLLDAQQISDAAQRTAGLLRAFQATPLWRALARAEQRLHELPYSYVEADGLVRNGRIDLLARVEGAWHLYDFKIDTVRDETAIAALLARPGNGYVAQVRGYITAVERLRGERPRAALVFLDVQGAPGRVLAIDVAPEG